MTDDVRELDGFDGTARLFPLPNLVLFPNVVQPLHVFEPRYRQMTADALAGDRLITPVLLKPGWDDAYDGKPDVYEVACLGRIIADQQLQDGRYNLLLRGIQRVRIRGERESDKEYRIADVEPLAEEPPAGVEEAMALRRKLSDRVLAQFTSGNPARRQLQELFGGELPLGALCDILGFALPVPLAVKQSLLEEPAVVRRAAVLIESLPGPSAVAAVAAACRKFPPDFSAN